MFRGLYTAVSSMQTNQKMLDIASNNMANVNTTGFKKDVIISETFPETLIKKINGQLPTEAVKLDGKLEVSRDGEGFQLATERGFFTVNSPMGTSYSRELKFTVDENGYLRTYSRNIQGQIDTSEGNFVLDGQGRRIQVGNNDIDINETGQLMANGAVVADLIHRPATNTIGTINSGRRFERTHINFIQGTLDETGNNLNFAINGSGFFKVGTPNGEMYTRNGSFTLSQNGQIVTSEGYPLLGQNGPITLANTDFQLGTRGQVIANGQVVDQFDMINVSNVNNLDKHGQSYYVVREGLQIEETPFEGEILQGFLEGSNINPINEMINMINIMRSYESSNRVVKAYDDILQRAANDVGKL
ncbi:flagellar hook-basal body protein [Alkaliphilus sp. B6464]|uniref:flagellar hook-basal body protein n=1 Tax=Alkaliphilus sp. B6464 TaxID=2731219 RepID=UPI001BAA97B4|nr:flagellar hook-basal body protein [Alkaliphilus sp. B6464]QUH19080.1 flagellar hook-basal body complex protein [Alkaliphilus sp. B6464]